MRKTKLAIKLILSAYRMKYYNSTYPHSFIPFCNCMCLWVFFIIQYVRTFTLIYSSSLCFFFFSSYLFHPFSCYFLLIRIYFNKIRHVFFLFFSHFVCYPNTHKCLFVYVFFFCSILIVFIEFGLHVLTSCHIVKFSTFALFQYTIHTHTRHIDTYTMRYMMIIHLRSTNFTQASRTMLV